MQDAYTQWRARADQVSGRNVFFVVGCQKSGTTWVQRLLDAHPRACCGGESHLLDLAAPLFQQALNAYNGAQARRAGEGRANLLIENDLLGLLRTLGDAVLAGYLPDAPRLDDIEAIGEKTPEHALAIGQLDRLYPAARFIHVIRDGRDAVASGWAHLQRTGETGRFSTLAEYATYFATHHWLLYINRARSAGEGLGERYAEVRYEDLHGDPEGTTRQLLAFLDLDASSEAVEQCLAGASFEKLSGGRQAGDEDRASFFRKGVVGDWARAFDPEALRQFESIAGEMLAELGYQPTAAWA